VQVTLAELVYPTLSMSAGASDPETSVREVSLYLELRYDCIDGASGEPRETVTRSGFYDSQGGCPPEVGHAENFSGRVRASATDSQGAVGWSSWVAVFESPF
jgi:hypothetical protein